MNKDKIPQGYKKSSLGIIPEDWEVKRLGEIFNTLKSFSFSRNQMTSQKQELRYIHYGDIHTGAEQDSVDLSLGTLPYILNDLIPVEKIKDENFPLLKNGDIILADASEDYDGIGKAWEILNTANNKIIAGLHTIVLRERTNYTSIGYGRYLFRNTQTSKSLKRIAQGTKVYSISYKHLSKLHLLFPPLSEQQRIAEILSCWDEAIEKQTQLIKQLELRKRGLMQQLLTGKGNRISAGEIFKNISVKGFDNEELLSATQDKGMIPRTMLEGRVTMPSAGTRGFKLVEKGDFVISLRSFQGGLEYSNHRGLVSPAYTVLKPKKVICEEYYKQYFKSYDFIGHLAIAVIGIRDGKQVSYEDFCTVRIPFPPFEEQTAIADILSSADMEIHTEKEKLSMLKYQKKGLIQQLLTGKKRVKI